MRVAFVQFNPEFGRIKENIERAEELMAREQAKLYVLPELAFSGYTFISKEEAYSLSETVDTGLSMKRMKEISIKLKASIVYGFPERDNDNLFNSCALLHSGKIVSVYRKIHLFMHEKKWFNPGDKPFDIHEINGCRVGMMICFDWRFPEASRSLALRGAHLICHPANLVHPHCQAAMVTRCLENRVFAITANRYGHEKRGPFDNHFTGRSQIINPRGEELISPLSDKDDISVADIDIRESEDKSISPGNDLWADRRPELYYREGYGKKRSEDTGNR